MTSDALRAQLAGRDRLRHDDDRIEVEPATVAAGGIVASYRVKSRPAVELLERRNHLTWRQARAGRRLYRAYALGIVGAREDGKGCTAHTPQGYRDLQLGAATDYRLSRAAVGGADWAVVFAVCIMDQTISGYAREHYGTASGRMVGLVMGRLRTGLDRLADYHEQADAADGM
jgi:hypothetical protein